MSHCRRSATCNSGTRSGNLKRTQGASSRRPKPAQFSVHVPSTPMPGLWAQRARCPAGRGPQSDFRFVASRDVIPDVGALARHAGEAFEERTRGESSWDRPPSRTGSRILARPNLCARMVRAASLPGAARNLRDVATVCEFMHPRRSTGSLTTRPQFHPLVNRGNSPAGEPRKRRSTGHEPCLRPALPQ